MVIIPVLNRVSKALFLYYHVILPRGLYLFLFFFKTVPQQIGLTKTVFNPATPPQPPVFKPLRYRSPGAEIVTESTGVGPKRVYLDIQSHAPDVAYPPRPVPGSVADLDHVMSHCDFGQGKVSFLSFFLFC